MQIVVSLFSLWALSLTSFSAYGQDALELHKAIASKRQRELLRNSVREAKAAIRKEYGDEVADDMTVLVRGSHGAVLFLRGEVFVCEITPAGRKNDFAFLTILSNECFYLKDLRIQ